MVSSYIINVLRRRVDSISASYRSELLSRGVSHDLVGGYDFIRSDSSISSYDLEFRDSVVESEFRGFLESGCVISLSSLVGSLLGSRAGLLDEVYLGLVRTLEGLRGMDTNPFEVGDIRYSLLETVYFLPDSVADLDGAVGVELDRIADIGLEDYIFSLEGVHFWYYELGGEGLQFYIAILRILSEADSSIVKLIVISMMLFNYGVDFYDFRSSFNELGFIDYVVRSMFRFDYNRGFMPMRDLVGLYTDSLDDYLLVVTEVS